MARRRGRIGSRVKTVFRDRVRRGRRRYSERKNFAFKKYGKKAAYGALAGLAIAVPLSLGAKYLGKPALLEAADRGGSIAAAAAGGPVGVTAYQVADALFDRFVIFEGNNISGGKQVYL